MDLEDGELPSSENEEEPVQSTSGKNNSIDHLEEDLDYVIVDRPKSSCPRASTSVGNFSSESSSQSQNYLSNPSFESSTNVNIGSKSYYNGLGVSDLFDSSDKDSSSNDESDDDYLGGKRSRMVAQTSFEPCTNNNVPSDPVFCSSTSVFGSSNENNFSHAAELFRSEAAKFQKERKPNLVWSNVIQEEQISNIFDRVRVNEVGFNNVDVERGPESYSFQRPMRQPRPRRASDSSDISSEGLSDNALHYLRDGFSVDDETGESSEHSLPKSFKSTIMPKSASCRKASKRKRDRAKYKRKLINKLKKMKSPDLAQYMSNKLIEDKVQLLLRAIESLGKENCVHIFLKTLKIERRGGVMVKNQERRRTAGGVFLYLIRGDRRFPKSVIDNIFREDRQISDKVRKKKTALKRNRKKAKFDAAKEAMRMDDGDGMKDDSDGTTTVPDPDGTDTGQLGDDSTQESSVQDAPCDEAGFEINMEYDPTDL